MEAYLTVLAVAYRSPRLVWRTKVDEVFEFPAVARPSIIHVRRLHQAVNKLCDQLMLDILLDTNHVLILFHTAFLLGVCHSLF